MSRAAIATIVIAGAGPVGLLLAALLARDSRAGGLRLIVLEPRGREEWQAAETDLRVYALSRASQLLLERLDLWTEVTACRASAYRRMHIWEGDDAHAAPLVFDAADVGEPDLGHIVEDRLLRQVLTRLLTAHGSVELIYDVGIDEVEPVASGVAVTTTGGERIVADLLVGADGTDSRVRRALDFDSIELDYAQHAVVAHLRSSGPHQETAWQRFLPGGPLALLPLVDGQSSVVWSVPTADAERLVGLDEPEFCAAVETASAGVLGRIEQCTHRVSFPLKLLHAVDYCRRSAVLIGDAAHVVHPLAGQGMNLGLLDAASLAAVLARATAAGDYPGDRVVLRRYLRERKAHNLTMQLAFDALNRLFGLSDRVRPLRVLGMRALDRAPVGKRWLVRRALGLAAPGLPQSERQGGLVLDR
jgi:2-octaprenylphenol hydroxylase